MSLVNKVVVKERLSELRKQKSVLALSNKKEFKCCCEVFKNS